MVAFAENVERVVPQAQLFRALSLNPSISSSHQQGNLLLVPCGVIFGFESIVQRDGIFRAFACLGEVHHSLFEIGQRYVFKGGLLGSLLDQKILSFADSHLPGL